MAGTFVTNVKQLIFDAIYRGVSLNMGSSLEIGLSTTEPYYDGSNFTEPVGNGYARLTVASTAWEAPDSTGSSKNAISFTFPTATGTWGDIGWAGVFEVEAPQMRELRKKYIDPSLYPQITTIPIAIHEFTEIIEVTNGSIVEFGVGDFKFGPWVL